MGRKSLVTYRIQHHAEDKPDVVHVSKRLPHEADFGEGLQNWIEEPVVAESLVLQPQEARLMTLHLS